MNLVKVNIELGGGEGEEICTVSDVFIVHLVKSAIVQLKYAVERVYIVEMNNNNNKKLLKVQLFASNMLSLVPLNSIKLNDSYILRVDRRFTHFTRFSMKLD